MAHVLCLHRRAGFANMLSHFSCPLQVRLEKLSPSEAENETNSNAQTISHLFKLLISKIFLRRPKIEYTSTARP